MYAETRDQRAALRLCAASKSAWVRQHRPPVRVVKTIPGDEFDEEAAVYRYMGQYGIDAVRGGSYQHVQLTTLDKLNTQCLVHEQLLATKIPGQLDFYYLHAVYAVRDTIHMYQRCHGPTNRNENVHKWDAVDIAFASAFLARRLPEYPVRVDTRYVATGGFGDVTLVIATNDMPCILFSYEFMNLPDLVIATDVRRVAESAESVESAESLMRDQQHIADQINQGCWTPSGPAERDYYNGLLNTFTCMRRK